MAYSKVPMNRGVKSTVGIKDTNPGKFQAIKKSLTLGSVSRNDVALGRHLYNDTTAAGKEAFLRMNRKKGGTPTL
mgnify:CR=1 FL=1